MQREILVSATPQESWVAILEDQQLVELMFDRPDQGRMVGDIYLGRVEAILPGIQAAFVDIGTEKAGFLHVSDLERDEDEEEGNGNGRRSRKYPPIQDQLRKGQELLVQVTKEPISTKGPRLTAQISLPGRFLVYMPFSAHVGVSRKIEDREERSRLRKMAKEIVPEGTGGVIVRTVGEEVTEETLRKEFKRLHGNWKKMQRKANGGRAPLLVHEEMKLVGGIIRDLFSDKFDSIKLDDKAILNEVKQYVRNVDPDLETRVHFYEGTGQLFDEYKIEDEIQKAFQRRVDLPSGGYIIIEPTEALVSIDVNTGRYTGKRDPEKTILRTNLEASREIARQLRLRDLGGIIVADFIDMETRANRDKVLQELRHHLSRDRARTKTLGVSDLGLVEMTRQRIRPSLWASMTEECPTCAGSGRVFTPEVVARRLERSLRRVAHERRERELAVRVHPEVALYLLEEEPKLLQTLRKATGLELEIRDDPMMHLDEFRLMSRPAGRDVTEVYAVA